MIFHNYDPEFNGNLRVQDTAARLSLSDYVYKKLWLKVLKCKDSFQHKMMYDGVTFIVRYICEILNVDTSTKVRNF